MKNFLVKSCIIIIILLSLTGFALKAKQKIIDNKIVVLIDGVVVVVTSGSSSRNNGIDLTDTDEYWFLNKIKKVETSSD